MRCIIYGASPSFWFERKSELALVSVLSKRCPSTKHSGVGCYYATLTEQYVTNTFPLELGIRRRDSHLSREVLMVSGNTIPSSHADIVTTGQNVPGQSFPMQNSDLVSRRWHGHFPT